MVKRGIVMQHSENFPDSFLSVTTETFTSWPLIVFSFPLPWTSTYFKGALGMETDSPWAHRGEFANSRVLHSFEHLDAYC